MKNNTPYQTEVKEVKTEKAYKVYHYSDGSTISTKDNARAGRPRLTLENGSKLEKVVNYVPLPKASAKEETEVVEGLEARQTVLTYSDGTSVIAGRGKRRQTLENGATLVKVVVRIPAVTAGDKKEKAPKAEIEEVIVTGAETKKTELVYANGEIVVATRGRPAPTRNGSPLVKIIRYQVDKKERVVKEKKVKVVKEKKVKEEEIKPVLTIPTTIPDIVEVGKTYIHSHNGAAVKVLEVVSDEKIIGEVTLDGVLTKGPFRVKYLRG